MPETPICGIYKITNKFTGESYIGQSIDIHRRWKQHLNNVKLGNKKVKYPLYRDMLYYGSQNFRFEILEECPREFLDIREEFWIKFYDTIHQYNQIMPKENPRCAKERRRGKY